MSEVSLRSRLIGAWQLVNFVMRDMTTNAEDRPWGEHPLGLILYTHDGYVSAQLQRPRTSPICPRRPLRCYSRGIRGCRKFLHRLLRPLLR